jgi:hypothetical protein
MFLPFLGAVERKVAKNTIETTGAVIEVGLEAE